MISFDGVDIKNYNHAKDLHPWIPKLCRAPFKKPETYSETLEVFQQG